MTDQAPRELLQEIAQIYQSGKVEEALSKAEKLFAQFPETPFLLNVISNSYLQLGKIEKAISPLTDLLGMKPDFAEGWKNLGVAHSDIGDLPAARSAFIKLHELDQQNPYALEKILRLSLQLHDPKFAEPYVSKLIEIGSSELKSNNLIGQYFAISNEPEKALTFIEKAIQSGQADAALYIFHANILYTLGRNEQCGASVFKAVELEPNTTEILASAAQLYMSIGDFASAESLTIRGLQQYPDNPVLRYLRGLIEIQKSDFITAAKTLEFSLALTPPDPAIIYHYLYALLRLGQIDKIEADIASLPIEAQKNPRILNMSGTISRRKGNLGKAVDAFEEALTIDPSNDEVKAQLLRDLYRLCDWERAAPHLENVEETGTGKLSVDPGFMVSFDGNPETQFKRAVNYARTQFPTKTRTNMSSNWMPGNQIKLGFFSGDFKNHPVGILLKSVIENINSDLFSVHLYATDFTPSDETNDYYQNCGHNYNDIHQITDQEALDLIQKTGLDIAIDLAGYTIGGRPSLFAKGVSPIQISFLGFPGTSGSEFMDYILADPIVLPKGSEAYYSEKPLHLPNCYMPGLSIGKIPTPGSRTDNDLPEDGFVFASFNNSYKIMPLEFGIWMRLLSEVKGSVLWLQSATEEAITNLRNHAKKAKIDPDRLVFAGRTKEYEDHIARLSLADLFLDSFNYTAQSTAMDVLNSGLPLLTMQGKTYAARAASSLISAAEMPELITHSPEEYEARALELARDPATLGPLRDRLANNKSTAPLFDLPRYCRDFEEVLVQTLKNHQQTG